MARLGLLPFAGLYALGWEGYLAVYRLGFKKAKEPHRPIVCVGNLLSGGSGKSPMTLHVAEVLRDLGKEVVVGCSGYGGPHAEAAALAPSGELKASEWGDEPAMFRWLAPDIPLVVGRRRVLAAGLVHQSHPNAVLLMDDGFQHLPLKKHLTILLDAAKPKNKWCLPAGPYREPRWNRRRADIVIPGQFRTETESLRLQTPEGSEVNPRDIQAFGLLCALGQPQRFVSAVEAATGCPATTTQLLADHDPLDAGTLLDRLPVDLPVVVTAKDWVKLRERPDAGQRNWLVARHRVRVEPQGEFRRWLIERLDG